MRILRVSQHCYPDQVGGLPYHVHALSRDQAAMGHDVTVATVGDERASLERDGYRVERYPATATLLGNQVSVGLARHLVGDEATDADVVHAHSHIYAATNAAALARRLGDTPLAITNHGLYSQSAPPRLFALYLRSLGRWTLNRADVVFCYTATDRDRLRDLGVSSDVTVVPNGVDTERFAPEGPEAEEVGGDPALLFVGRLVEGKRPMDAVETLARLRGRGSDARLVVCGDGPLRGPIEQRIRALGVDDAVRIEGTVAYERMPELYRAADVLLLPSADEGFPRTVLESLASGTPVVASDLPQLEDLIAGAGRMVAVGDVPGFADAIEDLRADQEARAAAGGRGRDRVVEWYRWTSTVEETTAALAELHAIPE